MIGKPVRAEKELIPFAHINVEEIGVNIVRNTQRTGDYIFSGVVLGFLGSDIARVNHLLHKRMVTGDLPY